MTRPHLHSRHTHGGLLSLYRYAQASRLSMVSPRLKAAFAVAVLLLCVAADSAAIGLVISAGMLAACIGCSGAPVRYILSLMAIPVAFILISCLAVIFDFSAVPLGFWDLPLPGALVTRMLGNLEIPIICMEGIEHAVVCGLPPTPQMAQAVLEVMPPEEAQGVLFVQGARMTPMVYVRATDTRVWESSCGSGTVALGWYLARMAADGEHGYTFEEPGGQLSVRVRMQGGRAVRAVMGGKVTLGEMREIEL